MMMQSHSPWNGSKHLRRGLVVMWVRLDRATTCPTLIVWAIDNVIARCELLHALLWVDLVDEVAEMELLHGMASGADLAVDLRHI